MHPDLNRRTFLGAGAAGLGYFFTASATSAARLGRKPNETLQFAGIGVGGKGESDIDQASGLGEVIAVCDIDDGNLGKKAQKWPSAKKYHDYRKLFDALGKQIDAVTVSAPDHHHALASLIAIRLGKHVYCQKPLTHTVFEARVLKEAARKHNVCTQMGNQGSAENGLRRAVELIQDGLIGPVREAHVWTNRPAEYWVQSPVVTRRPDKADVWPKSIHWDYFIGGAPLRPFVKEVYHPMKWRGWWDFGTGAIGDMACHTANMAFRALKLAHPTAISAESSPVNPETYCAWARVKIEFPGPRGDAAGHAHLVRGQEGRPPRAPAERAAGQGPQARRDAQGERLDPRRR